jgi:hypothetical protein
VPRSSANRRLLAPLVALLLLPFLVATQHPEEFCTAYMPSADATEECTTTGETSRLRQSPLAAFTGFEPTMQSDPDGDLFYATTSTPGVAIGFKAGVARSTDASGSWSDVTPTINGRTVPPETNDPYVYVDPWTGRVFSFHMAPILLCSILSFSDDKGASWTTNPLGCGPTGVWDHQTIVAAPPTAGVETVGYDNVLVQCVNAIYAAMCARSLYGGLTWTNGVPAYVNTFGAQRGSLCGAQHGHLASEADGTIYLPTSECGGQPVVYISRDSGLTWERSQVSDRAMPFQDPTVAVDAAGTIHVAFQDHDGVLWLSSSDDDGATWSDDVRITPPGTIGTKPAMVAGDAGHVAIAYPGTDNVGSFGAIGGLSDDERARLVWGGFWTFATDAGSPDATFTTVEATGADPLMRGNACQSGGRCTFQVDFIEATLTPDGQVWASFSDGCVTSCVTNPTGNNDAGSVGHAVAVTIPLDQLDLCADVCSRFTGAEAAEGTRSERRAPLAVTTISSPDSLPSSWLAEVTALRTSPQLAAERAAWASGAAQR